MSHRTYVIQTSARADLPLAAADPNLFAHCSALNHSHPAWSLDVVHIVSPERLADGMTWEVVKRVGEQVERWPCETHAEALIAFATQIARAIVADLRADLRAERDRIRGRAGFDDDD
jgi:hypothetical protein